ncbi:MAG: Rid family detoxifying hydrolase [Xanthomonadales bacterium]|nr:Rid family detoxifying hydrolase [Xanthomonadales bacterium]MCB1627274.1 Rid family detoxifying hydrolase [Xanthomonadales bacterium]MCB1633104.1 Rid family detoxifying hydrolase [Xanthomonadales bacterium]
MGRKSVNHPAAAAVGPYSHAVWSRDLLFLSGQTPIGDDGKLIEGDAEAQTRRCLQNLLAVLEAAGLGEADLIKLNVFLTDMGDFAAMNQAYADLLSEPWPARSTIGVAALPLGARVEIEAIARRRARPKPLSARQLRRQRD